MTVIMIRFMSVKYCKLLKLGGETKQSIHENSYVMKADLRIVLTFFGYDHPHIIKPLSAFLLLTEEPHILEDLSSHLLFNHEFVIIR